MKATLIILLLLIGSCGGPAIFEAYTWYQIETQALAADLARAVWYAAIILIPLAAIILASQCYGPSLDRIMGW